MKIHRAGYKIIIITILILLLLTAGMHFIFNSFYATLITGIVALGIVVFVLRFFRVPGRLVNTEKDVLVAPADGTVVAIEEVFEEEFLQKKALQISIFMSVWNVHINWFPANGIMKEFRYHPGKFLVARHPKSSVLNERTSILMETSEKVPVVIRQIAGIVARRIENYVKDANSKVTVGQEMGFIKFGSRVDVFVPLNSDLKINIGQKVRGKVTRIAQIPDIAYVS
ncbi:Phosphatidylserine decarboxylase proenzyme [Salinivirga cyanobacteriivorans]|uniref:Phosphatidylserine decarboxylase proenzyme n=1 Tax=Salinivirga cyanobacteriivorans TaxID=1307839 RepID=A0A0S2HY04_9BACT|nr:phosphatidylserine decarboxylase family protein [Salinivirga cyanobacteriivorans]ALO14943.1 Phosphatidylserine decarboxylase proenzyme [Salinivirga cyanobacteriivorans]